MTTSPFPSAGSAAVHILHEGYAREEPGGDRVGSTVTLIQDGDRVIVVDPGMVPDTGALLAALAAHGPGPRDVTDVVFSHHHPDHTINAALSPPPGFTITGPPMPVTCGSAGSLASSA